MKLTINAEFTLPAFSADNNKLEFPGITLKSNTDVDMTEDEFKLMTNCAHEISKEWLPIKQEIVKAIFGAYTFKNLWIQIWSCAGDALQKLNPFRTAPLTEDPAGE